MASSGPDVAAPGPVLFAYDGSELAQLAIEQAARELAPGRDALVLCVWQPGDVGFLPVGEQHFNAQDATEVEDAAEDTAAHGAALAEKAGFRAESVTIKAAPTWKGIVEVANNRRASLIVLGSHRRTGVIGHLLGSVTDAVIAHSTVSILVVHQRPEA
jgi:nucleotide-binding universal stress UspA family protein